jgi:hypothetical protein
VAYAAQRAAHTPPQVFATAALITCGRGYGSSGFGVATRVHGALARAAEAGPAAVAAAQARAAAVAARALDAAMQQQQEEREQQAAVAAAAPAFAPMPTVASMLALRHRVGGRVGAHAGRLLADPNKRPPPSVLFRRAGVPSRRRWAAADD